ncbi:MAG TPA: response regulator [Anaerolineaceae bacterium]|nr:response regulator [Anaerolineaceae bacterium]
MAQPTALIIEDDEKLADIFSLTLQSADFITEIVSDGALAMARLEEVIPNVVILDLHLPHVSGPEILRMILATESLAHTKVIVTTADDRLADTMRGKAHLVLLKPVSPEQLRQLAQRLLPTA